MTQHIVDSCDKIQAAISIQNLSFRYRDQTHTQALHNIDFQVNSGQFVVVMGPSGAGKSTLAHCLNGLIPHFVRGHYEGTVEILGRNSAKETVGVMSKDIGLVFQDFEAQLFSTNTRLEIAFGPENFNVPWDEMEKIIHKVIETVKLKGLETRQPASLSGGQKQRLAIGSVLAICPTIICMDEPTTDLDPLGKRGIFQIAKKLHDDQQLTVILIEHETEEALHADRIILMDKGTIIKDGSPFSVLREVELFDRIGIMPMQIPTYFSQLGFTQEELPLTCQDGLEKFKSAQLVIDENKYQNIVAKDAHQVKPYGDVILSARNVQHTYPTGNQVIKGVDLEIRQGEFVAILGQNGSGKTTLAKHFNGLLKPTAGTIIVNGRDVATSTIFEIGKDVGYVFQNPDHQIFSNTVYDEVAFSPKMRGFSHQEIEAVVKEALRAVDMEGYEQEDPFCLTKGERQRVAVASVLSARPKIIILDEPTTGLDYKEQRRMMELVRRLNENGHTIIMITHSMWVVAEYAHRVAVMREGRLTLCGTPREIFRCETQIATSDLKAPPIVEFSNLLGYTLLSVEEIVSCTTVKVGDL